MRIVPGMKELPNIRLARIDDAEAIAALSAELGYAGDATEFAERLARLLPDPGQFVCLAEASDGVLGWIAAARRLILESGDSVEIVGLVVAARGRRRGIGAALVAAAERWAAGLGVSRVVVRSNVARAESHPFYLQLGYAPTKTQQVYRRRLPSG